MLPRFVRGWASASLWAPSEGAALEVRRSLEQG